MKKMFSSCRIAVMRNRPNYALRLYGSAFPHGYSWETTTIPVTTPKTSKEYQRLERIAASISLEMERGEFSYLKHFPRGNCAQLFLPGGPYGPALPAEPVAPATVIIEDFYAGWIKKKIPPLFRKSLRRSYEQHWRGYIQPFFGKVEMAKISFDEVENFRIFLIEEKKISLKTARNVIDGTLQAMFRDARLKHNPFDEVPTKWWPRQRRLEPDPFTEEERDAILNFYREKRPFREYAFVLFRFYTGTRPGEATGLKWGRVDLLNGKATIAISRTYGEENAPKTTASHRSVNLLPNVVDALKFIQPLHADAENYAFTDNESLPIDQDQFRKRFADVLRVLKIRPRPFYNTRHTCISVALTLGCNPKWIAEQNGTSLQMIQSNYGKYIRQDGDALLREYVAAKPSVTRTVTQAA